MTSSLFRPEVSAARSSALKGDLSVVQPLPLWWASLIIFLVSVSLIGLIFFAKVGKKSEVQGELVPSKGLISLLAPREGVISEVLVPEGEIIKGGAPLLTINVPKTDATGGDAALAMKMAFQSREESLASIQVAAAAKFDARAVGLKRQLSDARRELSQINSQINLRSSQIEIDRKILASFEEAGKQQYVSGVQINQQRQSVLSNETERLSLDRSASALERTISELEQNLNELSAERESQFWSTKRDQSLLLQDKLTEESSNTLTVKASTDGLVTSRRVEPGQVVKAGDVLMSVLPKDSSLEVQLKVLSKDIGFIRVGDKIGVRFDAYPYQKFGRLYGRVVRISRSSIAPTVDEYVLDKRGSNVREPFYDVRVHLDQQHMGAYGRREVLMPGMQVDADVFSEKRSIVQWLFEPLWATAGGGWIK